MSFDEKSAIYNSLLALVKAQHPFDNALQDRTVRFLKHLEPEWSDEDRPDRLVMDLVHSSPGSPSGFINSPYHRPTLEFVLASPITMGFSTCVSIVERDDDLWVLFGDLNYSLQEWKDEGPDTAQSAKRMMQTLFSEGFEDTLEQTLMHNKGGHGLGLLEDCYCISRLLGSNVERPQ
ncbi:hypothetical protein BLNAU_6665 [Blattamonas nauphoetae]|nr:hypothetical protein BLNAU_6665 [Blattamonas nauphoetae]